MKKVNVEGLEVSELCLGGGKMVEMSPEDGKVLMDIAIKAGINIFDCHHRYGNAEKIVGKLDVVKMSKVSAYVDLDVCREYLKRSKEWLGNLDILWISDLDDDRLYSKGQRRYEEFKKENPTLRMGITSESPTLALKFAKEYPDCKLFMVPIFPGCRITVEEVAELKRYGKVFSIKPFDDGRCFEKYTVTGCLEAIRIYNPDVVVFGTSNPDHLKVIVSKWTYGEVGEHILENVHIQKEKR
jgi:hypothetical protein